MGRGPGSSSRGVNIPTESVARSSIFTCIHVCSYRDRYSEFDFFILTNNLRHLKSSFSSVHTLFTIVNRLRIGNEIWNVNRNLLSPPMTISLLNSCRLLVDALKGGRICIG